MLCVQMNLDQHDCNHHVQIHMIHLCADNFDQHGKLEHAAVKLTKGVVNEGVGPVSIGLVLKGLHIPSCALHITCTHAACMKNEVWPRSQCIHGQAAHVCW